MICYKETPFCRVFELPEYDFVLIYSNPPNQLPWQPKYQSQITKEITDFIETLQDVSIKIACRIQLRNVSGIQTSACLLEPLAWSTHLNCQCRRASLVVNHFHHGNTVVSEIHKPYDIPNGLGTNTVMCRNF